MWLFVGFITLVAGPHAYAESISTTIHHQYQAPRPLGMGDAFIAVANDYNALFYNPAGLARREDGQINLSMDYAFTPGAMDFYNEYKDIEDAGLSDVEKTQSLLEMIENHYGDVYSLRVAPMQGIWVRPKWGVGFIPLDLSVELAMHRSLGAKVNATAYADTTLAVGYGDDLHWFDHGRLSWGLTGKFVNRGFFSQSIEAADLAKKSDIVRKRRFVRRVYC